MNKNETLTDLYSKKIIDFYNNNVGLNFEEIKNNFYRNEWKTKTKITYSKKKNIITIKLIYLLPTINSKTNEVIPDLITHVFEFRNVNDGIYNEYIENVADNIK